MPILHDDCFAYKNTYNKPECVALKKLYCAKNECNFYKTEKQRKSELKEGIDCGNPCISSWEVGQREKYKHEKL